MISFKNSICVTVIILLLSVTYLSSAEVIGNSGGRAGLKLELLTTKASINTLQATAEMYKMISHIEDPDKDKIDYAKSFSHVMKLHLDDSVRLLRKATDLPSSEFKGIDNRINERNLSYYFEKYNIHPEHPVWQEIFYYVRSKGGRGWLEQNKTFNENLLRITNIFIKQYSENPSPKVVWELMRAWNGQIYRGMYLSIILTE